MAEQIFPEGMRLWPPHKNAPEFIKGQITVRLAEFKEWAKNHVDDKDTVRIDLKMSRSGELYLALNTFKREDQPAPKPAAEDDPASSIPF